MLRPGGLAGLGVAELGEVQLGNYQREEGEPVVGQHVPPAAYGPPGIIRGATGQVARDRAGFAASAAQGALRPPVRSEP